MDVMVLKTEFVPLDTVEVVPAPPSPMVTV
jgi:hypothetical protein